MEPAVLLATNMSLVIAGGNTDIRNITFEDTCNGPQETRAAVITYDRLSSGSLRSVNFQCITSKGPLVSSISEHHLILDNVSAYRCTVVEHHTGAGGIFSVVSSNLIVLQSSFRDNLLILMKLPVPLFPSGGSAIFVRNTPLEISDSVFERNAVIYRHPGVQTEQYEGSAYSSDFQSPPNRLGKIAGGAILILVSPASLTNCNFVDNHIKPTKYLTSYGGAIGSTELDALTLENVHFSRNFANFGGALSAAPLILSSPKEGLPNTYNFTKVFADGNYANAGGAIYIDRALFPARLSVTGSVFTNNSIVINREDTLWSLRRETTGGGAIAVVNQNPYYVSGYVVISDSTFLNNSINEWENSIVGGGSSLLLDQPWEVRITESIFGQYAPTTSASGIIWIRGCYSTYFYKLYFPDNKREGADVYAGPMIDIQNGLSSHNRTGFAISMEKVFFERSLAMTFILVNSVDSAKFDVVRFTSNIETRMTVSASLFTIRSVRFNVDISNIEVQGRGIMSVSSVGELFRMRNASFYGELTTIPTVDVARRSLSLYEVEKAILEDCYFSGGFAAVEALFSPLVVERCDFYGIKSYIYDGTAIRSDFSSLKVYNTLFRNLYGANGGAIKSTGTLEIRDCRFRSISASGYGGAIHALKRNAIISNTTFSLCSADFDGGAIFQLAQPAIPDSKRFNIVQRASLLI